MGESFDDLLVPTRVYSSCKWVLKLGFGNIQGLEC